MYFASILLSLILGFNGLSLLNGAKLQIESRSECDTKNPSYIGCYVDDGSRDLYDGPKNYGYNQQTCNEACQAYPYFALQNNGWCVCGAAYATEPQYVKRPDGECGSKGLGGGWRNSIYHTCGYEAPKGVLGGECAEGNAKLDADNVPYLFYGGKWSPICGHCFWDNQDGAKAFCQELGYSNGRFNRGGRYDQDAIEVGKCRSGESINSCSSGCNQYKNTGWCKKGNGVKITISCEGHTKGTEKDSCPVPTTTTTTEAPTTPAAAEKAGDCEDKNELCQMEPSFLLDILCQIDTVKEQCPKRCNSCPEPVETTEAPTTTTAMPKCERKYNGYYSYGDCGSQNGVNSFEECCELTKQRNATSSRNIIRFSWNGNSCAFKCGGKQDNRGGSWWSSAEDISTCTCQ